jgi:putative flippase GtrA
VARAALASLAATLVDGGTYQLCVAASRATHGHYAYAAALGAALGAVTNFSISRWWAFHAEAEPLVAQALRYAVGSVLTLLVLQGVLWVLIERLSLSAYLAWLPAKAIAWLAFSYPFQRLIVFNGAPRR